MTRDDIIEMARETEKGEQMKIDKELDILWYRAMHDSIRAGEDFARYRFAALLREKMISEGWRQCAEGQRTTQHCAVAEQARDEAERYKASASMWRNKAYELGGYSLPWDADEMLEKARQEERNACLAEFMFGRNTAEIKSAIRARGNK